MKIHSLFTLVASVALITSASASITMDWVNVGNAGNAAATNGSGAVAYAYQIGKYEVTNAQYAAFLNAKDPEGANPYGIYNVGMGTYNTSYGDFDRGGITYTAGAASGSKYTLRTTMGNKPVNFVGVHDAARFANWMMNGQGSGSMESGAYTLNGATSGTITKNVGANIYLPDRDEWHKAAYYDPTKDGSGGYWAYATQSDTAPTAATYGAAGDVTNPGGNVATYQTDVSQAGKGMPTTVGSAAANNYYGTFDQAGNVWEWADTGVIRGGSMQDYSAFWLNYPYQYPAGGEQNFIGFRLANSISAVPEPSSLLCMAGLLGGGLLLRRRSKHSL